MIAAQYNGSLDYAGAPGFLITTLIWGSCNQVFSAVRQNRLETICRYALLSVMAVPLILIASQPLEVASLVLDA